MKYQKRRPVVQDDAESVTALAIATQAGLGIVLPLVGGGLLGWYLDGHVLHSTVYIATLIGLLLGLVVGVYSLIRLMNLLR